MKTALHRAAPFLKLLFGVAVFTWMAKSGKINFAQVGKGLAHWPLVLGILALNTCQIGLMVWRWRLLLRAQDIDIGVARAWSLTMIGLLFNVIIPGAVGGDLIKGYYITRVAPDRKSGAATSILMDRVLGLLGLFLISAPVIAAHYAQVQANPGMRTLGSVVIASVIGGLIGLYGALYAGERLARVEWLPKILRTVFLALHEYHKKPGAVRSGLAISVLNQGVTCATYYLALRATGVAGIPASAFFMVVPLGLVTSAVPISPGGLGVGQAAFFALFQIVTPGLAQAATDAYTVFQALYILFCLTGLFWYLRVKDVALAVSRHE